MNMDKNRIPKKVKNIHLVAVCGTGMGALAGMLTDLGYRVTGSDQKAYPPMSDFLEAKGIPVYDGFSGKNIGSEVDLVIIGNAVREDNPEVIRTRELNLHFCSMPQAVNQFMAKNKKTLVVAGTHGKTTTASLLAWLLHYAGLDPSFMIGGILKNFGSNYRLGTGPYMVIEGDEYDTAFFDKRAKFFHYTPHIAIVTGVEFDHADIFRDLDHVRSVFAEFIHKIPETGLLLCFDNSRELQNIASAAPCKVAFYGKNPVSRWRLGQTQIFSNRTDFEIFSNLKIFGKFSSRLMGEHNLLNTLAVIAACQNLDISMPTLMGGLEDFKGIRRRQEVRGIKRGITVMDDFAHHPTAVRETIRAVKPFTGEGRLIAVFEPRTNTSMRNVFQDVYPQSFDDADVICIRKPSLLEKIPEKQRFSSEKLVADLQKLGKNARYFPNTETIIDFLLKTAKSPDTILIMSNGGFDNIHKRLLKRL